MKLIKKYFDGNIIQHNDATKVNIPIVTNMPLDDSLESKFYRDLAYLSAATEAERKTEDNYNRATNQGVYLHTIKPTNVAARTGHMEIDPRTGDIIEWTSPIVKVNNLPGAWKLMALRAWDSPAVQLALAPIFEIPSMLSKASKVAKVATKVKRAYKTPKVDIMSVNDDILTGRRNSEKIARDLEDFIFSNSTPGHPFSKIKLPFMSNEKPPIIHTQEEWDALYFDALNSGNMEEVQRLRNLHFKELAPFNLLLDEGEPVTWIHATDDPINVFDLSKTGLNWKLSKRFGRNAIFFDPSYGWEPERWGKNPYKFYINAQNGYSHPLSWIGENKISVPDRDFITMTTGEFNRYPSNLDLYMGEYRPLDFDWKLRLVTEPEMPATEIAVFNPNIIKSAEAVTYDNNGRIIPLSMRDNFNNPDVRYALNYSTQTKPTALTIGKTLKQLDSDVEAMNKYHHLNVDAYNEATGSSIRSVPFRTDFTGRQIKILPDDEFNKAMLQTTTNLPTGDVRNIGGVYSRKWDTMTLRNRSNPSNNYHEGLHSAYYGETNPEVTKWRISLLVDEDLISTLSPKAKGYFLSESEAPVHLRQWGANANIAVGEPYPGDAAFDALINKYGLSGASAYMKHKSSKEKLLLWKAFNGTLFGAVPLMGSRLNQGK